MKITPLKSPGFGYNADYHKNLHNELSKVKQNKELAKSLIASDELSLKIEDEIVLMEKDSKKYKSARFKDLTDYLTELKQSIALFMSIFFEKFEYPETMIMVYSDEANKATNDTKAYWRDNLASKMMNYVSVSSVDQESANDNQNITSNASSKNETNASDTINSSKIAANQAAVAAIDQVAMEILEPYTPTSSSPKGFCDVVGMEDVKLRLQESIVDYAKNPQQAQLDFEEYGIPAPRGFLFYGHPGSGKTYITQALAQESGLKMYKLDISKAGSKFVNQTSNNLQYAFDYLKYKAEQTGKPVLLFMDEVDSLAMSRGSVVRSDENMKTVSTVLKLVEGAKDNNIIVIAATNKYDLLDDAFKARFDGQVYFPISNQNEIQALLKYLLSKRKKGEKLASSDEEIKELAKFLEGHSNRSITFIVEEASKYAKRRNRDDITFNDIKQAAQTTELEKTKDKNYNKASRLRQIGFLN